MSETEVKKCPKCSGQMERRALRAGGGGYFVELSDSESVWKMGKHEKNCWFPVSRMRLRRTLQGCKEEEI